MRVEGNFKQITLAEEDVQALNALIKLRTNSVRPSGSLVPITVNHQSFIILYLAKPRWDIKPFNKKEERNTVNKLIVTTETVKPPYRRAPTAN